MDKPAFAGTLSQLKAKDAPAAFLLPLHFSFAPSRILTTAVQLHLFSHLNAGHDTVPKLAQASGASPRGLRMLLDALVAMEVLEKQGDRYRLTPFAARYLVRESPDYVGHMLERDTLWQLWTALPEAVKTGRPVVDVTRQQHAEEFFPYLVQSLHIIHREPARRLAEALGAGRSRRGLRVLDVACGSAVWSLAIAGADREARVTALDFPQVLEVTRTFVEASGVADRYEYLPGNLRELDFGHERYDVILLGNIVHGEGERVARELFRKAHRALAPAGRLVIIDMVPNDERTGPPFPLFFALNMLLHTAEGDTFTLAEYRRWLEEAGFHSVEPVEIGTHSPAIVATRS